MADKKSNTSVLDIRTNHCDYGNQRLDIWIMPDWCNNSIKIDGDEQTLKEIVSHLLDGNFLNYCNPIPAELKGTVANFTPNEQLIKKYGYSDWYSWCVDNWGTKWDINVNQIECSLSGETEKIDIVDSEEFKGLKHINFWFESAYNAPISAYNALLLKKPNLKLTATYYEKGYWFCGVYKNGVDDYKDEIPSSDDAYWDTDNGKLLIQWTGLRDEIINDEENEIEE